MLSFKVVRCPHPICSTHQKGMCGVPPFEYKFFCAVSPPCNSVPLAHLALSWILSKVKNLARSSLQDEAIDWLFFTELLGPSLIIISAQLVSPRVALPAELVWKYFPDPVNQFGIVHVLLMAEVVSKFAFHIYVWIWIYYFFAILQPMCSLDTRILEGGPEFWSNGCSHSSQTCPSLDNSWTNLILK